MIKDQLDAIDRGLVPPAATGECLKVPHLADHRRNAAQGADHFQPRVPASMRLSREELLNATGLRSEQLSELEQFGLITARTGGHYDDDALAVGKVVVEMARFGLEGRHLRAFRNVRRSRDRALRPRSSARSLRSARHPEAKCARGGDGPRTRGPVGPLHAALVQIGLRDVTEPVNVGLVASRISS